MEGDEGEDSREHYDGTNSFLRHIQIVLKFHFQAELLFMIHGCAQYLTACVGGTLWP